MLCCELFVFQLVVCYTGSCLYYIFFKCRQPQVCLRNKGQFGLQPISLRKGSELLYRNYTQLNYLYVLFENNFIYVNYLTYKVDTIQQLWDLLSLRATSPEDARLDFWPVSIHLFIYLRVCYTILKKERCLHTRKCVH